MAQNLVPPGDCGALVTASGGKVYIAYQTPKSWYRASYTVDERTGQVTDNHDPHLDRADIRIVCMFLRSAHRARAVVEVERRYADLT
jgi:hypothetical protein